MVGAMKIELELITTWLKKSGLKVNEAKTKICLLYKKDTHQIEIIINIVLVKSIPHKMNWGSVFTPNSHGPCIQHLQSTMQAKDFMQSS